MLVQEFPNLVFAHHRHPQLSGISGSARHPDVCRQLGRYGLLTRASPRCPCWQLVSCADLGCPHFFRNALKWSLVHRSCSAGVILRLCARQAGATSPGVYLVQRQACTFPSSCLTPGHTHLLPAVYMAICLLACLFVYNCLTKLKPFRQLFGFFYY